MELADLIGWTPIAFSLERPEPTVDWCDLRGIRFAEPFLQQTVARWTGTEAIEAGTSRPVIRTTLPALAALDAIMPVLDPSGLVFHMSRCRSTLISRLLATAPGVVAVSEPEALNTLLEADPSEVDEAALVACVRMIVRALGQRRFPEDRHFILKLSSWNIRRRDILRAAFPDIPWVWVYRAPIEVVASVLKTPPAWTQLRGYPDRAARLLGIERDLVPDLSDAQFCCETLAGFLRAALTPDASKPLLVDYSELPHAIWTRIAPFFKIPLEIEAIERMQVGATFYAKDATPRPFLADTAEKRAVSPELAAMVQARLGGLYSALTEARVAQVGTAPAAE
jgi:hypothetical protein